MAGVETCFLKLSEELNWQNQVEIEEEFMKKNSIFFIWKSDFWNLILILNIIISPL